MDISFDFTPYDIEHLENLSGQEQAVTDCTEYVTFVQDVANLGQLGRLVRTIIALHDPTVQGTPTVEQRLSWFCKQAAPIIDRYDALQTFCERSTLPKRATYINPKTQLPIPAFGDVAGHDVAEATRFFIGLIPRANKVYKDAVNLTKALGNQVKTTVRTWVSASKS